MKRCPECRRDYMDDTLSFCLDDGAILLEGPATDETKTRMLGVTDLNDEPQTAILNNLSSEAPTKYQIGETEKTAILPKVEIEHPPKTQTASTKNTVIAGIIGIVLVTVLGIGSYWLYGTRTNKQIESIAVMPFINESGNADTEYLSDGMTETLISSLSQLPNLNVKARSSVFRYKSKDADVQTIGKELNVQAILNGRVIQRGDQLTLSLELIDAQTENVIWSERYNRKQADLVSLQSEIARDVSSKLKAKLSGADEQRLAKNYTANPEAYQLYLKGRFFWNKRTTKDLQKAIEFFQQAIALDPNYALAYTGLADAFALLPTYGTTPPREVMPKAREAALKALSLDDQLAEAYISLGLVLNYYDYDFAGAEARFKRAIELNPNSATARHFYGNLLISDASRHEEAIAELRRALEIDPLSPLINRQLAIALFYARRYDDAITQLEKTLELDPNFAPAYNMLSNVYQLKGDYARSVEALAKHQELIGESQNAVLTRESFARGGWHGFLRTMTGEQRPNFTSYSLATFYVALGEKDKAISELEQSFEKREFFLTVLKIDPRLDPLHDDPRFQELLKKVGFPQEK
jgi:TolB-like protein/Flp pilus assembly protein TadD